MDGTLIDSTHAVPAAFIATLDELGGPPADTDAVVAAYALGVPEVILAHLLARPLQAGESDRYYNRLLTADVQPYPGLRAALATVSAQLPVALFTGASRRSATILLQRAGLADLISVVVGGDEVTRPKPAPDGILEACRRLGCSPSSTAYLGDAPTDLLAARAAGACSVAAGWGHLYSPEASADITLTHPGQIVEILPVVKR